MHARERGADTWWKSFTTGKSAETLGGIPHDTYGMTSLSIRQYVTGLYNKLGLKEKDITKVQTGGPGELVYCYLNAPKNRTLRNTYVAVCFRFMFGIDGDLGSSECSASASH